MSQTDNFKEWLKHFLIDLDKEIDTDVYLDYLFEILSNYSTNSNNKPEIVESIHSILESLLPNIDIISSEQIFNQYSEGLIKQENIAINLREKSETDILSAIIKNDQKAIDKNKRQTKIDPRYALDYLRGDEDDNENDDFSESEIDAEFSSLKIDRKTTIDDVIDVIVEESGKHGNNDKEEAIAATKMMMNHRYNSENESDTPDCDPLMNASGKSNREALDKANQESRMKMKESSQQKKDKDKQDRLKQKEQQKARKENEKKRTQKSERRR